jgi:hypothetical protein
MSNSQTSSQTVLSSVTFVEKGQKTCVWVGKFASVQGRDVQEAQTLCSRCCVINVFDDHDMGGDASCKLIAHRKALVGWKKEMSALVSEFEENNHYSVHCTEDSWVN